MFCMHELFMSLYEISSKLSKLERQKRKIRNIMPKTAHRFQMLLSPCITQHDQHNKALIIALDMLFDHKGLYLLLLSCQIKPSSGKMGISSNSSCYFQVL